MLLLFACNFNHQAHQQESTISSPPSQTLSIVSSQKKILFLGDSLTEGYGIDKSKAYPSLIQNWLDEQNLDYKVINASISGSTSASAVGRLKWQLKNKPDILVLALGANDGLRGIDPKTTYSNLSAAIELAHKESIQVLLIGMKLPYNYGLDYRKDFEASFKRLVNTYDVAFVPFLLKDVGGKPEMNIEDGIHPNEKGHEYMTKTVLSVLKLQL